MLYERPRPVCNPFTDDAPCAEDDCCLRPGGWRPGPRAASASRSGPPTGRGCWRRRSPMRPAATPRWAGDAQVRVAVWAEMAAPRARVIDNTDAGSLYGVLSPFPPEPPIDAAEAGTHDVRLSADWGPAGFDGPRVAGPFALLDTARTASQAVLAARPGLALVPLTIQWSVLNDRCNGDDAAGCIGTSHWDGRALSILGKADVDTDEFDAHVVAHEWTHALEATVGRADSIGGSHSSGQLKDPRLAFGEGLASGVAAMVLHPDPVYIDTTGVGASRGFFQDMQDNSRDRNPGWFSEATVRTFLYDLFDDDDEPGDAVALGLGASSTPCWAGTPSKLQRFRRFLARGRGEGARRSRRHRRPHGGAAGGPGLRDRRGAVRPRSRAGRLGHRGDPQRRPGSARLPAAGSRRARRRGAAPPWGRPRQRPHQLADQHPRPAVRGGRHPAARPRGLPAHSRRGPLRLSPGRGPWHPSARLPPRRAGRLVDRRPRRAGPASRGLAARPRGRWRALHLPRHPGGPAMSALLALLLLSPAGLASPKEDPRVRIEATRDADTVIFTIHLAPDATEVRVQVYGTDGLVAPATP
ncbi:MAG: hypothetical protein R3F43_16705 [bacterium]